MRWRQFLTPVMSLTPEQARALLDSTDTKVTVLDVRQPAEYAEGHIPGALLVPLADLSDRMAQLSPASPVLVYCAVGGRSRIAAQLLAGNGFDKVMNLSGGFKAWNGAAGYGDYDAGLELFPQDIGLEMALVTAWNMENALEEFYATMVGQVAHGETANVFGTLAKMEATHKRRLQRQYAEVVDAPAPSVTPDHALARGIVEGGSTTAEYMRRAAVDVEDPASIIQFAMILEAQAMDLYARAARKADDKAAQNFLESMIREERSHLSQLASLLDRHLQADGNG